MLQQELTSSLRQNLLWERQQKNATSNAVAKRQQSALSLPALRRAATTNDIKGMPHGELSNAPYKDSKNNNSYTEQFYSQGLQEYHERGW